MYAIIFLQQEYGKILMILTSKRWNGVTALQLIGLVLKIKNSLSMKFFLKNNLNYSNYLIILIPQTSEKKLMLGKHLMGALILMTILFLINMFVVYSLFLQR